MAAVELWSISFFDPILTCLRTSGVDGPGFKQHSDLENVDTAVIVTAAVDLILIPILPNIATRFWGKQRETFDLIKKLKDLSLPRSFSKTSYQGVSLQLDHSVTSNNP